MIIHIALFKWKKGTSEEKINELLNKIRKLNGKIDNIKEIYAGKNYHPESKGFTHGVVVIAENHEGLDNYREDSYHKILAEDISDIEDDGIGFDFKNFS